MGMFHSTATLIIAHMTLISQWEHEIRKSLKDPAALAVHIYDTKLHGKCSLFLGGVKECEGRVCHGKDEHLRDRIERIASENDIILVSYRMLQTDRKPFQSIHWRRIVLDEMQEIRSSTTDLAKVCKKLSSGRRDVWYQCQDRHGARPKAERNHRVCRGQRMQLLQLYDE